MGYRSYIYSEFPMNISIIMLASSRISTITHSHKLSRVQIVGSNLPRRAPSWTHRRSWANILRVSPVTLRVQIIHHFIGLLTSVIVLVGSGGKGYNPHIIFPMAVTLANIFDAYLNFLRVRTKNSF